jgi:hypothetical protein
MKNVKFVLPAPELMRVLPLKFVDSAMRSISTMSAAASAEIADRFEELRVSSAAWVASPLRRSIMSPMFSSPLSAVCRSVIARPMFALDVCWPTSWVFIADVNRPAASSAALLMRRPVMRRPIWSDRSRPVRFR